MAHDDLAAGRADSRVASNENALTGTPPSSFALQNFRLWPSPYSTPNQNPSFERTLP